MAVTEAYSIELGWNAMSKAPRGYFRSQPIAGVSSRPDTMPTIIRVLDTGGIEILNADHPGSIDAYDTLKN